jgi:hypothetical protein
MARTEPRPQLLTVDQLAEDLGLTLGHLRPDRRTRRSYVSRATLPRRPSEITRRMAASRYPEPPSGKASVYELR